jgi:hypothetical protein
MSPIDRFTDACVSSAARRWPVGIADLMASEWRAELAYARRDPHAGRLARAWRQLTFALSLAMSPSGGSENPVTPRWRTRLTGLGPAAHQLVVFLGVSILAHLLPNMVVRDWTSATRQEQGGGPTYPMWLNTITTTVLTVLTLLAMALLGTFAARRMSPRVGASQSARSAVQLGTAFLITYEITNFTIYSRSMPILILTVTVSIVFWTVCAAALTAYTARTARTGRVLLARTVTAFGLLVITDLTAVIAGAHSALRYHLSFASGPLWLPISIDWYRLSQSAIDIVTSEVRFYTLPLLLLSAFLVTYAIRRPVAAPAAEPAAVRPATPRVPWASTPVRGYALGLAAVGLGIWTFVGALGGGPQFLFDDPRELLTGGHLMAIALILAAFAIYNAGRGPVSAPTAAIGLLLLAADHAVDLLPWHGPALAAGLVVFGAAVLAGAWWLVPRLTGPGTTDTTARRALVVVAVTAAFAIPTTLPWSGLATLADIHEGDSIPTTASLLLALGSGMLLAVTGLIAALASRRDRLPWFATIVAALAVGALYTAGTAGDGLLSLLYYPQMQFFIQPIIAVAFVAIARWPRHRRVRAFVWTIAGCAAAGVAAVLALNTISGLAQLIEYVVPTEVEDLTEVVAHLVVGLALALVFAARLVPPDTTEPADPETAPIPLSPATA